ncbi:MAG: phenylacetate-CoA oxygenase subunit PaaC, partial [Asticcacaulis sp.]|nr:phenylacetate-CoA oxygenase subunit PaaC [Asticcacaulis sp.]
VLGQKLSQWCGHAPCLEVDLGLSSLALDLVGQGTDWLQLAAKIGQDGRDADTLAFKRDPSDFRNCLLVAQPNGDFAQTLARQFLFSNWQYLMLDALSGSSEKAVANIAERGARDVGYHVDFARDWMIRLGDGACLSHTRLVKSLDDMARYVDELFVMDDVDEILLDRGVAIDKAALRGDYDARIMAVLHDAGLTAPRPQPKSKSDMAEMHFNSRSGDVRWGF